MKNQQENQLSRDLAISKVFDDNPIFWNNVAALAAAVNNHKAIVQSIQTYRQGQEMKSKGVTQTKASLKVNLINTALKVSAGVIAYASAISDNTLKQKVNYKEYELKKSRDTILYDQCKLVYETANPLATQIATYFVTATDLTALNSALASYLTAIPQPRTAKAVSKSSTTKLKQLFAESEKLIKEKIDGLMLPFKQTKPEFYNSYINAKKIVKAGSHKISIIGKVTSKKNNNVIQSAIILNEETGQKVTTTRTGGFRFRSLVAGKYDLTVSKKGFVTTTFIVAVEDGKTSHTVLEIEKS